MLIYVDLYWFMLNYVPNARGHNAIAFRDCMALWPNG